jgi:hypothetical protein
MLIAYFIGYLITILIFSLLNTAILRFAANIILKRMPSFKKAFYISFASSNVFYFGGIIASWLRRANMGSVLNSEPLSGRFDSSLINILPFLVFMFVCWILNSNYLPNAELRSIGFGKGLAVTAVQSVFLIIIGLLLITIYFVFWGH